MFLWSWISVEAWSFRPNENEELRRYHQQRMNARRRRSKQVIYEEDEEYRGVDRALGHTRID